MKSLWKLKFFNFCLIILISSNNAYATEPPPSVLPPPEATPTPPKPPTTECVKNITIEHMVKQAQTGEQEKSQSKGNALQTLTYDPNGKYLSGSIPIGSDYFITGPLMEGASAVEVLSFNEPEDGCSTGSKDNKTNTYSWKKLTGDGKTFKILIKGNNNKTCLSINYIGTSHNNIIIEIPRESPLMSHYLGFDVGAGVGVYRNDYFQHFTSFAVHFNFSPTNKDGDIPWYDFNRRFSVFMGLTLEDLKVDKKENFVRYEGILANKGVLLGVGYRIFKYGRISIGGIIFKRNDLQNTTGRNNYGVAPIISISLDLDLFLFIEKAYRSATTLFEKK